jgi:hypothetical protein
LLRCAEHRLGKVYPNDAILGRVAGERDARVTADFENAASYLICCGARRATAAIEQSAKDQIVDGSPTRIRLS